MIIMASVKMADAIFVPGVTRVFLLSAGGDALHAQAGTAIE